MAVDKKLALKRIEELFSQAESTPKYATRYVELARKIAMKAQVSMPLKFRRLYCHKCYSYTKDSKRRIVDKVLIVTCGECGNVNRFPFSKRS